MPFFASTASAPSFFAWLREAKMWTVMYRGGLSAGAIGVVVFVLWRFWAARRERERLEALVASRTRQLRQSEELFRSIFEHASEGIFQSSLDGRNLRANPAMARICGYGSPEEMTERMTDAASQFYAQPGRRAEINARLAREGEVTDCESEIRCKDGRLIWISESVRTVTDPATGHAVYQGSIVDVTARRQTLEALARARADAEDASAAKSAFLAHVTHELRTPLTGILSGARVALREPALDAKTRERLALIAGSGEHLLHLVNEVLDLSRIEAGRLELRPAPFDLGGLLHTVREVFQPLAAERRLEFHCEPDPRLPRFVLGDGGRLRQVLDNLVENALKFTDRGHVILRVNELDDEGYPLLPDRIQFEVRDTGIGIAGDQLAAIFQPFHQTPTPGRVSPAAGAGLGLNISERLVKLMGGWLVVESAPGHGSRFFFRLLLPAADDGATLRDLRPPGTNPLSAPSAAPAPEELDALLALAQTGDIVRLRARLAGLAAGDPAHADFARELDRLAAGFRMRDIDEFLERARRDENAP